MLGISECELAWVGLQISGQNLPQARACRDEPGFVHRESKLFGALAFFGAEELIVARHGTFGVRQIDNPDFNDIVFD